MKEILLQMKKIFAGKWAGEGFAKFPTIHHTAYSEQLEFIPDEYKDAIFFRQKSWYKNDSPDNGHTVFWDTGFILLKEEKILLNSVQVGGRIEMYELSNANHQTYTFNNTSVLNDVQTVRSQRIFTVDDKGFRYQLNMATHAAAFQNHLTAHLKRSEF